MTQVGVRELTPADALRASRACLSLLGSSAAPTAGLSSAQRWALVLTAARLATPMPARSPAEVFLVSSGRLELKSLMLFFDFEGLEME